MKEKPDIVFCESPFVPNQVDEDYEEEFAAAQANGFATHLFSFEDLISEKNTLITKKMKARDQRREVIYRGWMLTPKQYSKLYDVLFSKNYQLINTVVEYQNCHYLPDSLRFISTKTPQTIYEKFDQADSIDKLLEKATIFGKNPVILKDYVKSEKHHWDSACFVPDASDKNQLKKSIEKLLELRNKYLNEGIVIRAFVELNALIRHSKSGMPLTEEYRLFFVNQKMIGLYDYWEEGEYSFPKPDITDFEEIAKKIESNFFSMDIARQKDGNFIIIELGDGQVAGLPEKLNKNEFYKQLSQRFY